MKNFLRVFSLTILLLFSIQLSGSEKENVFFSGKKEITVVITDSGLGGLSVMDDIGKKILKSGHYKKVNLIFVNALFNENRGYNALSSREEKIEIFNKVLFGIEKNFKPDIIMIACNTLSVISGETEFVKKGSTRVEGIVETGVKLICEKLNENENAKVIITGTETTISEDSHRASLIRNGIAEDRIILQACPQLQSYIEQDPSGEDTEMLISIYMEEAAIQLDNDKIPVYLSLNCTHFPYSLNLWQKALQAEGINRDNIINPNIEMGKILMPDDSKGKYPKTKVSYSVVSKVKINNKDSIVAVFEKDSPKLSIALENYNLMPELF